MRIRSAKSSSLILLVASGIVFIFACGVQGPPQPPRVERPERIRDLVVHQVGQKLEIRFTAPSQATDGERLSKPIEIQIFRAVTPPAQKPPETASTIVPWATLLSRELPRYEEAGKIAYVNRLSTEEFSHSSGSTFTFAVRALTRGFRGHPLTSEFSNLVRAILLDVSAPPEKPETRTTERALELTWSAPSQSLTGHPVSALSGYLVYRSEGDKPGSFQLRAETQSPIYFDPDFQFGRTYVYKIRGVFKLGDQTAESEDSLPVTITPLDTFPPAPPSGLSAVYGAQAVEVIWNANKEPDLAGYNVYRREEQGMFQRINKELLPTPIYHDSGVQPSRRYSYRVTSVDLSNNESPPSGEAAVETR